jgi:hypothetical protein
MSNLNNRINVAELDFDKIKENLKDFFRGQDEFKDYDFEGAGLSMLLDVLAYNTHYNNLYTNLAVNESFLDSASKRSSIVSLAKTLGYMPRSAKCAKAVVDVRIVSPTSNPTVVTLPAYQQFETTVDGINYTFFNTAAYTVAAGVNGYVFSGVELLEGTPLQYKFTVTTGGKYVIPNPNVDTDTIRVRVQDAATSGTFETYTYSNNIVALQGTSKIFFLKEVEGGLHEISFGDDILGKKLSNGNIVTVDYFVSGMADRLFDLEPAIEMSAQLQVMGGAWADLADPFKLMYMARNDTNALTESVANAAKESMSFAKDGSIETTAEAMHKLRIVAQQTGLEYDDLMEAGKKAFKMGQIKTKVFGVDDETKEFIANTAEFANGKATITIDGQPKLLSMLSKADKDRLKEMVNEKKSMEDRAKAALSFDEKITNLINMVKISMMPIVEGISSVLGPLVDDLMGEKGESFRKELVQLGKDIGGFVAEAASWIKGVANLAVALGPQGIFYTWLTGKALMFLFEKANWVLNGIALSTGFLGGQAGKGLASMLGTGFAKIAGPLLVTAAAGVAGNLLGKKATEASGRKSTKAGDTASMWAGGGAALAGAAIGSAFGGVGAIPGYLIGAGIGALAGGFGGKYLGDMANQDETASVNDGIIKFNKNDKFTKVNDSTMIAGTNENGNKDLARTLKYASLAAMPFGLGAPMMMSEMMKGGVKNSTPGGGKIEFGELHITGEIKVSLPGGTQIGSELVKSPEFKSSITKMVNSQIEKNMNGGKNRG